MTGSVLCFGKIALGTYGEKTENAGLATERPLRTLQDEVAALLCIGKLTVHLLSARAGQHGFQIYRMLRSTKQDDGKKVKGAKHHEEVQGPGEGIRPKWSLCDREDMTLNPSTHVKSQVRLCMCFKFRIKGQKWENLTGQPA